MDDPTFLPVLDLLSQSFGMYSIVQSEKSCIHASEHHIVTLVLGFQNMRWAFVTGIYIQRFLYDKLTWHIA